MHHVLCVCIATIAISLLTILALDVVPLQPLEAGWDENISFWCRTFCMSFIAAEGSLLQLRGMAPASELTIRKIVRIGLFTAAGYTASAVLLARVWVFPIPFMTVVVMPAWLVFFVPATALVIGLDKLRQDATLQSQLQRFARRLSLEVILLVVYPAYSVAFVSLTGWAQVAFILLLPVVKFCIKRMMKRALANLEDLVPAAIITVDFFNALYQSKCMQSSDWMLGTIGIIGIDVVQNVLALRELFGYMQEVKLLGHKHIFVDGAIAAAIDIAKQPARLDADEVLEIRVASCAHFRLSENHEELVQRMAALQNETRARAARDEVAGAERRPVCPVECNDMARQIFPVIRLTAPGTTSEPPHEGIKCIQLGATERTQIRFGSAVHPVDTVDQLSRRELTPKERAKALKRTLELLWRCELVLLVEYVEATIPMLYALYLAILHQLPNAQYYPGVASLNSSQLQEAMAKIVMYGALELLSLAFVHLLLKRRFKLSPLHQLAFTLESEYLLVQGAFLAWVVVLLQFTLVHNGVDFAFHFSWLSSGR